MAITIKNEEELELMRRAGQMLARVHAELAKELHEGMTTRDIDRLVEEMILSFGGYPNFKNYHGFPAAACVSVNDEVVHGIPSDRVLKSGDIVSVDTGVLYKGYHSDAARTHAIGEISEEAKKLIRITEEAFFEAIKKARPGNHVVDIGQTVQRIALKNGYSVVRDLTGHGIGTDLHEAPNIPNYKTLLKGPRLRKGMTLAVEPMINIGNYSVKRLENNWTYATTDGSLSSHYENTIAITDQDCEILTMLPEEIRLRFSAGETEEEKAAPRGDIQEAIRVIPEEFALVQGGLGENTPADKDSMADRARAEEERIPVGKESQAGQTETKAEKAIVGKDSSEDQAATEAEKAPAGKESQSETPAVKDVLGEEDRPMTQTGTVASEHQPKAPYQTLSPEAKRIRRETLFEDD